MYPCIYTKDKKKKLKTWLEGFYKYTDNKLSVYDSEKKLVCTKVTKLDNEIDTFKYLVYIEDLNEREEQLKEFLISKNIPAEKYIREHENNKCDDRINENNKYDDIINENNKCDNIINENNKCDDIINENESTKRNKVFKEKHIKIDNILNEKGDQADYKVKRTKEQILNLFKKSK